MSNKLISEFGICNNKSIGGESIFQNILNVYCLKFHKETFKLLNKLMYNNLKPKIQSKSSGCLKFLSVTQQVLPKIHIISRYSHTRITFRP